MPAKCGGHAPVEFALVGIGNPHLRKASGKLVTKFVTNRAETVLILTSLILDILLFVYEIDR